MMSGNECIRIDEKNLPQVKVFTDHTYTRSSGLPWHPVVQPMEAFLRIHAWDAENKTEKVFHTIDNENTLVIYSPPNPTEACNVGSQAFRFSKIFPENSCPKAMCNTVFRGVLDTVAKGDNFLVFNYGTTTRENALTMQGSESPDGLVPNAIEALFQLIGDKVSQNIKIKPQQGHCIPVGLQDAIMEHQVRNKILKRDVMGIDQPDVASIPSTPAASEGTTSDTPANESTQDEPTDLHYSIWVSCLEVYNELVYDLLEDNGTPKRRVALRLCETCNDRVFVKDATEVCVFTAAEAIKLFKVAQENLHNATQHLFEESSLSHCIFTIRILYSNGTSFKASKMNQLTFCNLATSEKILDAQPGSRGQVISASIIALGKCLESIRSGDTAVPYKESKLTRLLQSYFTGRSRALMMVNINMRVDMFDSTMNVLKFSALTSKVLLSWPLDFLAIPFRPTRCSIELLRQILTGHDSESWISPNLEYMQCDTTEDPMQSGSLVILDDEEDDEDETGTHISKIKELVDLIHLLQQHLIQEKLDKMQLETTCQKKLCSHFASQMRVMEDYYMDRIDLELDEALGFANKCPPTNKLLKPSRTPGVTLVNSSLTPEEKDSCITKLEDTIATLNVSLETALDSESEAQQRILSLDSQRLKAENRVIELEAQLASLNTNSGANSTSESQAQELIAHLQLRICKQQHENNVNETLLNQQLNDLSDKLRAATVDLRTRDSKILQLENQVHDLEATALSGVSAINVSAKEEINQFQLLLDSVHGRLKKNEAAVDVLRNLDKCTSSIVEVKENTCARVKVCEQSVLEANKKVSQLKREKDRLLDTLEAFQKMLLKATVSARSPMRPRRQCATPRCTVIKRECPQRTYSDNSCGGTTLSSMVEDDYPVSNRCLRPLRNRNDVGKIQCEPESRIRNLEAELASLKVALKHSLDSEGHSQKLPEILEALELGRALPGDFFDSPSCGYMLRQRP